MGGSYVVRTRVPEAVLAIADAVRAYAESLADVERAFRTLPEGTPPPARTFGALPDDGFHDVVANIRHRCRASTGELGASDDDALGADIPVFGRVERATRAPGVA